ncbi:MAG TPA: protein kinase [Terriglobales bacterium]|jgi:serine/threonine-protein kinase|nr:protein kinase [Terriglobales bacterium]
MAVPEHTQIGDYEIVRELGHGGMGQVYLVRNMISDRVEAMKVLLPDLAQQGELANRFMREIKVLASLEHPNIAQLRTAFTANNQLVMIMEYVEGETLDQRLHAGAFSVGDAINYISQVLTALSYAHTKGIIHRDIKPGNMMLTPQGVVKLMDFGIARSTQDLGMTATGTTLGSLDYMSPEQVKSEPTDARSDIYSVGVSLYEMITGHRMFSATSSYSVMEAHVKEIPKPPIEVNPAIPKVLSDIIMMAVAKDPAQRFQTADAFRNALSQVGVTTTAAATSQPQAPPVVAPTPQPVSATPTPVPSATPTPMPVPTPMPPRGGGRHIGWIVVAAIVILVALFGGTQVYRRSKSAPATPGGDSGTTTTASTTPATQPSGANTSATAPSSAAPANTEQPNSTTANSSVPNSSAPSSPVANSSTPNATTPNSSPPPANSQARAKHPSAGEQANLMPPPSAPAEPQPSAADIAAQRKLVDDMENEMDHLDSRASAVESSLDALEQQMHQSGFGLRGDIVSSRASMRTDLGKAKDALQAMDTDRARRYLDQANHEIQKLEAFLGRR